MQIKERIYTLDDVHEKVSTSKGLWSESVIKDRGKSDMSFFIDTSSLVKIYHKEENSQKVIDL